jgi:hypothetical protein
LFKDVYRLAKTPRIIYWYEWSPEMLRAAALHMMQLLKVLLDINLTLRNPHPWNLLYDGTRFQYVNPASIVPFETGEFLKAWDKVLKFLVRPVLLASQGKFTVCRSLLRDIQHGVPAGFVDHPGWEPEGFERNGLHVWLSRTISEFEALSFPTTGTVWLGYHNCERFQSDASWIRKQTVLETLLRKEKPRSVLDLAANAGHYARTVAMNGCEAIATDVDDSLVDQIFRKSQQARCAVSPAVLDFTNPAPALGVDYRWFPAATERMRSDLVLCYSVQHHLVFGRYRLDFDEVAQGVASFSNRATIVEYIPISQTGDGHWRDDAPWYSLQHLTQVFRAFFANVDVLPGSPQDRRLIVCTGRRTN